MKKQILCLSNKKGSISSELFDDCSLFDDQSMFFCTLDDKSTDTDVLIYSDPSLFDEIQQLYKTRKLKITFLSNVNVDIDKMFNAAS